MDLNFQNGEELFQFILLGILIFFTLILLIVVLNIFMTLKAVLNEKAGIKTEPFTLNNFWDRFNSLKPMSEEKDILLDHDYDGIKELDNHLPPWWLGMFYGGIVFGVVYLLNYHVWHWSPLQAEEYEIAMAEAAEIKAAGSDVAVSSIDENNVELLTATADLETGELIYTGNCAVCHGAAGEGGVGPNLTDEYWLHGGSISDIYKTIVHGVPEKGMIAWEGTLKPKDIQQVSSFIKTLEGSNPPNGKAPQGEIYTPEEAPATDAAEEAPAEELASVE
ncbi:cbb3-type cytochrome c oxidase N-terminal domain-containing protein [Jiulongibacter sediminis]|uniref:Cytochrome oxidase subunit III n=1 Tax=Jiulongibacter sediminis TaxID=1605367 RepID=A0A0P7BPV2_9BACT|nr:cbb3-type cytochrome c oxidase N-terminal domain-containing protein [Jiulongibacter sediminis]KPM49166.1 cytochrome oxidase subunit III [Jiulongibacter sediminis]